MKTRNNLLIRTDANTQIGAGHVMRCLALGQAWLAAGGQVVFMLAEPLPALDSRLKTEGMQLTYLPKIRPGSLEDASATVAFAQQQNADWIVVDGYHFNHAFQKRIKDAGYRLLFLDDNGDTDHYYTDWVLNQNIHAEAGLYKCREPYSQLLLGLSYTLLRREFWPWRSWQRRIPEQARHILVTLGGSDPNNVTLKVIHALKQIDLSDLEVVVVVGGSNPHNEILQTAVSNHKQSIQFRQNVTNMPDLMAWADIAISAGGSTCWELAFMETPSLLLILAENQRSIAEKLGEIGFAANLGWHEGVSEAALINAIQKTLSQEVRQSMSEKGRKLVDGYGACRVVSKLLGAKLNVRQATNDDARLLWEWTNDALTRKFSYNMGTILWETHKKWFMDKLNDPTSYQFIAENRCNESIGQIRFDVESESATISISISPTWRRLGYGTKIIQSGIEHLLSLTQISHVDAFVKAENNASKRIFIKAGFALQEELEIKGTQSYRYTWDNPYH